MLRDVRTADTENTSYALLWNLQSPYSSSQGLETGTVSGLWWRVCPEIVEPEIFGLWCGSGEGRLEDWKSFDEMIGYFRIEQGYFARPKQPSTFVERDVKTAVSRTAPIEPLRYCFVVARERMIQRLETIYSFRRKSEVWRFLRDHPHLVEILLEAVSCVRQFFGPAALVSLEITRDPEGSGRPWLFVYIRTSLPSDEALARLEAFDEEWFLDQLPQVVGQLNFNLEFA